MAPSVGSANKGGEGKWAYAAMARTERYMGVWNEGVTDPRCQVSGEILRDGQFLFNYALTVNCLKCKESKDWVGSLTEVKMVMIEVIRGDKKRAGGLTLLRRVPGWLLWRR